MAKLFACLLACCLVGHAAAEDVDPAKAMLTQPGRYQIVFSQNAMTFAFLLDTATGKTWKLTQYSTLPDKPVAWEVMDRLTEDDDFIRFFRDRTPPPPPPPAKK